MQKRNTNGSTDVPHLYLSGREDLELCDPKHPISSCTTIIDPAAGREPPCAFLLGLLTHFQNLGTF